MKVELQRDAPGLPGARLLLGGQRAFPEMLDAIRGARERLQLEVYSLDLDTTGRRFVRALGDAARRGVRVFVRLDGVGSWRHGRLIAHRLRSAGAEVELFHPLIDLLRFRLRRDHRKLLVVDRERAFLGGLNLGDVYARPVAEGGWADLMLEVRGPLAASLSDLLDGHRRPLRDGGVRLLFSSWGGGSRLRRRYLKAIGSARERVQLAHAYFLPDARLRRSLSAAARRGVRVEVLVPGLSDVPLMRGAMRAHLNALSRAGVVVRECRHGVLHAKVALVDDERLLLGSFNLDPLSLLNQELLAEVHDASAVAEVRCWFEALFEAGEPVPAHAGAWERLGGRLMLGVIGAVVWVIRWGQRQRIRRAQMGPRSP